MTSRELTGLLSLSEARSDADDKRLSDMAWRIGFGAIGWPWLLRGLSGGRKADKRALLAELGLPADALPHLGSWKADMGFLRHIVREIAARRPAHVVELGAGASTLIAAKALALHGGGTLHSYDQHAGFAEATRNWLADNGLSVDIRHAPLDAQVEGWPGRWYALTALPDTIDMLIIDGPPWAVHPLVRGAAASLFDRLSPGAVVLLDDAARPGERLVARRWRREWPQLDFRLASDGTKGTLVGQRRDRLRAANDDDRGSTRRHLARAAGIAALIASGWIAHGVLGDFPQSAQASTFLDEAAASRRAALLREAMPSQIESATLDAGEIRKAAGITLPALPPSWRVTDVQLFPTADDSPSIVIALTTPTGERLSLFADRAETPAEARPLLATRKGEVIAYWEAGEMAYALTGDAPANRIMALAAEVAPGG